MCVCVCICSLMYRNICHKHNVRTWFDFYVKKARRVVVWLPSSSLNILPWTFWVRDLYTSNTNCHAADLGVIWLYLDDLLWTCKLQHIWTCFLRQLGCLGGVR